MEVDKCDIRFVFGVNHQIKFVEVSMNETIACQLDDQIHQGTVDSLRMFYV